MVKQICVEENVRDYLQKFVDNKTSAIGLLIGSVDVENDYVVKLVRCIPKDPVVPANSYSFDGEWVGGMAVEISHMLPGGLNIIGLFAITLPAAEISPLLKQALLKCHEVLKKSKEIILKQFDLIPPKENSWILAHFDLRNAGCISCKNYNVENDADPPKSSHWKYQSDGTKWGYFHTYFQVDEVLCQSSISLNPVQYLKECIHFKCKAIASSCILFDGKAYNPNDEIGTLKNSKGLPEKFSTSTACKGYNNLIISSDKEMNDVKGKFSIQVKGGIFSCAYLPIKSTFKDVVFALKQDAICNLHYRCVLTSELIEEQGMKLQETTVLCLPRRYSFTDDVKQQHFMFFDFVFLNEEMDSVLERIEEAFDIHVISEMVKTDIEEKPINLVANKLDVQEEGKFNKRDMVADDLKNPLLSYSGALGAVIFSGMTLGFAFLAFFVDSLFPSEEGTEWFNLYDYVSSSSFLTADWFPSFSFSNWWRSNEDADAY